MENVEGKYVALIKESPLGGYELNPTLYNTEEELIEDCSLLPYQLLILKVEKAVEITPEQARTNAEASLHPEGKRSIREMVESIESSVTSGR